MAWLLPPTFADGVGLTAAQMNQIRDCLSETAAAKATTTGSFFVTSGVNTLAERQVQSAFTATSDTTSSTSYGDLDTTAGPAVTATVGAGAMVFTSAQMTNNTAGQITIASVEVTGASSFGAALTHALEATSAGTNQTYEMSYAEWYALTAGSNTFTLKYRVGGGTGSFANRRLVVMPF